MHAQFCSTWWNSKKLQAATFHILPGFVCIEIKFFSRRFTLCPSWLNYKTTLSSRHIQSDHQFYPTIIDEKPNSNLIQFGSRATKRWKFQKTFPVKLVFALPRLFIQVVFNKLAKSQPLTFNQFPFFSYLATQKKYTTWSSFDIVTWDYIQFGDMCQKA